MPSRINLECTEELRKRFGEAARNRGLSLSAWIRLTLTDACRPVQISSPKSIHDANEIPIDVPRATFSQTPTNGSRQIPGLSFKVCEADIEWYQAFVNVVNRQPTDYSELARFIAERKQG